MYLSGYSSAVYGLPGTKLGREVGVGHGKKTRKVCFHGDPCVAMLTRKFSHSHDIGARVMIFCEQGYISLINSLAKNEHNLPCMRFNRYPLTTIHESQRQCQVIL